MILVISREKDRTRALLDFLDEVERKLGEEKSYLFDVKVIYEDEKELPPFRSFLKDAVKMK